MESQSSSPYSAPADDAHDGTLAQSQPETNFASIASDAIFVRQPSLGELYKTDPSQTYLFFFNTDVPARVVPNTRFQLAASEAELHKITAKRRELQFEVDSNQMLFPRFYVGVLEAVDLARNRVRVRACFVLTQIPPSAEQREDVHLASKTGAISQQSVSAFGRNLVAESLYATSFWTSLSSVQLAASVSDDIEFNLTDCRRNKYLTPEQANEDIFRALDPETGLPVPEIEEIFHQASYERVMEVLRKNTKVGVTIPDLSSVQTKKQLLDRLRNHYSGPLIFKTIDDMLLDTQCKTPLSSGLARVLLDGDVRALSKKGRNITHDEVMRVSNLETTNTVLQSVALASVDAEKDSPASSLSEEKSPGGTLVNYYSVVGNNISPDDLCYKRAFDTGYLLSPVFLSTLHTLGAIADEFALLSDEKQCLQEQYLKEYKLHVTACYNRFSAEAINVDRLCTTPMALTSGAVDQDVPALLEGDQKMQAYIISQQRSEFCDSVLSLLRVKPLLDTYNDPRSLLTFPSQLQAKKSYVSRQKAAQAIRGATRFNQLFIDIILGHVTTVKSTTLELGLAFFAKNISLMRTILQDAVSNTRVQMDALEGSYNSLFRFDPEGPNYASELRSVLIERRSDADSLVRGCFGSLVHVNLPFLRDTAQKIERAFHLVEQQAEQFMSLEHAHAGHHLKGDDTDEAKPVEIDVFTGQVNVGVSMLYFYWRTLVPLISTIVAGRFFYSNTYAYVQDVISECSVLSSPSSVSLEPRRSPSPGRIAPPTLHDGQLTSEYDLRIGNYRTRDFLADFRPNNSNPRNTYAQIGKHNFRKVKCIHTFVSLADAFVNLNRALASFMLPAVSDILDHFNDTIINLGFNPDTTPGRGQASLASDLIISSDSLETSEDASCADFILSRLYYLGFTVSDTTFNANAYRFTLALQRSDPGGIQLLANEGALHSETPIDLTTVTTVCDSLHTLADADTRMVEALSEVQFATSPAVEEATIPLLTLAKRICVLFFTLPICVSLHFGYFLQSDQKDAQSLTLLSFYSADKVAAAAPLDVYELVARRDTGPVKQKTSTEGAEGTADVRDVFARQQGDADSIDTHEPLDSEHGYVLTDEQVSSAFHSLYGQNKDINKYASSWLGASPLVTLYSSVENYYLVRHTFLEQFGSSPIIQLVDYDRVSEQSLSEKFLFIGSAVRLLEDTFADEMNSRSMCPVVEGFMSLPAVVAISSFAKLPLPARLRSAQDVAQLLVLDKVTLPLLPVKSVVGLVDVLSAYNEAFQRMPDRLYQFMLAVDLRQVKSSCSAYVRAMKACIARECVALFSALVSRVDRELVFLLDCLSLETLPMERFSEVQHLVRQLRRCDRPACFAQIWALSVQTLMLLVSMFPDAFSFRGASAEGGETRGITTASPIQFSLGTVAMGLPGKFAEVFRRAVAVERALTEKKKLYAYLVHNTELWLSDVMHGYADTIVDVFRTGIVAIEESRSMPAKYAASFPRLVKNFYLKPIGQYAKSDGDGDGGGVAAADSLSVLEGDLHNEWLFYNSLVQVTSLDLHTKRFSSRSLRQPRFSMEAVRGPVLHKPAGQSATHAADPAPHTDVVVPGLYDRPSEKSASGYSFVRIVNEVYYVVRELASVHACLLRWKTFLQETETVRRVQEMYPLPESFCKAVEPLYVLVVRMYALEHHRGALSGRTLYDFLELKDALFANADRVLAMISLVRDYDTISFDILSQEGTGLHSVSYTQWLPYIHVVESTILHHAPEFKLLKHLASRSFAEDHLRILTHFLGTPFTADLGIPCSTVLDAYRRRPALLDLVLHLCRSARVNTEACEMLGRIEDSLDMIRVCSVEYFSVRHSHLPPPLGRDLGAAEEATATATAAAAKLDDENLSFAIPVFTIVPACCMQRCREAASAVNQVLQHAGVLAHSAYDRDEDFYAIRDAATLPLALLPYRAVLLDQRYLPSTEQSARDLEGTLKYIKYILSAMGRIPHLLRDLCLVLVNGRLVESRRPQARRLIGPRGGDRPAPLDASAHRTRDPGDWHIPVLSPHEQTVVKAAYERYRRFTHTLAVNSKIVLLARDAQECRAIARIASDLDVIFNRLYRFRDLYILSKYTKAHIPEHALSNAAGEDNAGFSPQLAFGTRERSIGTRAFKLVVPRRNGRLLPLSLLLPSVVSVFYGSFPEQGAFFALAPQLCADTFTNLSDVAVHQSPTRGKLIVGLRSFDEYLPFAQPILCPDRNYLLPDAIVPPMRDALVTIVLQCVRYISHTLDVIYADPAAMQEGLTQYEDSPGSLASLLASPTPAGSPVLRSGTHASGAREDGGSTPLSAAVHEGLRSLNSFLLTPAQDRPLRPSPSFVSGSYSTHNLATLAEDPFVTVVRSLLYLVNRSHYVALVVVMSTVVKCEMKLDARAARLDRDLLGRVFAPAADMARGAAGPPLFGNTLLFLSILDVVLSEPLAHLVRRPQTFRRALTHRAHELREFAVQAGREIFRYIRRHLSFLHTGTIPEQSDQSAGQGAGQCGDAAGNAVTDQEQQLLQALREFSARNFEGHLQTPSGKAGPGGAPLRQASSGPGAHPAQVAGAPPAFAELFPDCLSVMPLIPTVFPFLYYDVMYNDLRVADSRGYVSGVGYMYLGAALPADAAARVPLAYYTAVSSIVDAFRKRLPVFHMLDEILGVGSPEVSLLTHVLARVTLTRTVVVYVSEYTFAANLLRIAAGVAAGYIVVVLGAEYLGDSQVRELATLQDGIRIGKGKLPGLVFADEQHAGNLRLRAASVFDAQEDRLRLVANNVHLRDANLCDFEKTGRLVFLLAQRSVCEGCSDYVIVPEQEGNIGKSFPGDRKAGASKTWSRRLQRRALHEAEAAAMHRVQSDMTPALRAGDTDALPGGGGGVAEGLADQEALLLGGMGPLVRDPRGGGRASRDENEHEHEHENESEDGDGASSQDSGTAPAPTHVPAGSPEAETEAEAALRSADLPGSLIYARQYANSPLAERLLRAFSFKHVTDTFSEDAAVAFESISKFHAQTFFAISAFTFQLGPLFCKLVPGDVEVVYARCRDVKDPSCLAAATLDFLLRQVPIFAFESDNNLDVPAMLSSFVGASFGLDKAATHLLVSQARRLYNCIYLGLERAGLSSVRNKVCYQEFCAEEDHLKDYTWARYLAEVAPTYTSPAYTSMLHVLAALHQLSLQTVSDLLLCRDLLAGKRPVLVVCPQASYVRIFTAALCGLRGWDHHWIVDRAGLFDVLSELSFRGGGGGGADGDPQALLVVIPPTYEALLGMMDALIALASALPVLVSEEHRVVYAPGGPALRQPHVLIVVDDNVAEQLFALDVTNVFTHRMLLLPSVEATGGAKRQTVSWLSVREHAITQSLTRRILLDLLRRCGGDHLLAAAVVRKGAFLDPAAVRAAVGEARRTAGDAGAAALAAKLSSTILIGEQDIDAVYNPHGGATYTAAASGAARAAAPAQGPALALAGPPDTSPVDLLNEALRETQAIARCEAQRQHLAETEAEAAGTGTGTGTGADAGAPGLPALDPEDGPGGDGSPGGACDDATASVVDESKVRMLGRSVLDAVAESIQLRTFCLAPLFRSLVCFLTAELDSVFQINSSVCVVVLTKSLIYLNLLRFRVLRVCPAGVDSLYDARFRALFEGYDTNTLITPDTLGGKLLSLRNALPFRVDATLDETRRREEAAGRAMQAHIADRLQAADAARGLYQTHPAREELAGLYRDALRTKNVRSATATFRSFVDFGGFTRDDVVAVENAFRKAIARKRPGDSVQAVVDRTLAAFGGGGGVIRRGGAGLENALGYEFDPQWLRGAYYGVQSFRDAVRNVAAAVFCACWNAAHLVYLTIANSGQWKHLETRVKDRVQARYAKLVRRVFSAPVVLGRLERGSLGPLGFFTLPAILVAMDDGCPKVTPAMRRELLRYTAPGADAHQRYGRVSPLSGISAAAFGLANTDVVECYRACMLHTQRSLPAVYYTPESPTWTQYEEQGLLPAARAAMRAAPGAPGAADDAAASEGSLPQRAYAEADKSYGILVESGSVFSYLFYDVGRAAGGAAGGAAAITVMPYKVGYGLLWNVTDKTDKEDIDERLLDACTRYVLRNRRVQLRVAEHLGRQRDGQRARSVEGLFSVLAGAAAPPGGPDHDPAEGRRVFAEALAELEAHKYAIASECCARDVVSIQRLSTTPLFMDPQRTAIATAIGAAMLTPATLTVYGSPCSGKSLLIDVGKLIVRDLCDPSTVVLPSLNAQVLHVLNSLLFRYHVKNVPSDMVSQAFGAKAGAGAAPPERSPACARLRVADCNRQLLFKNVLGYGARNHPSIHVHCTDPLQMSAAMVDNAADRAPHTLLNSAGTGTGAGASASAGGNTGGGADAPDDGEASLVEHRYDHAAMPDGSLIILLRDHTINLERGVVPEFEHMLCSGHLILGDTSFILETRSDTFHALSTVSPLKLQIPPFVDTFLYGLCKQYFPFEQNRFILSFVQGYSLVRASMPGNVADSFNIFTRLYSNFFLACHRISAAACPRGAPEEAFAAKFARHAMDDEVARCNNHTLFTSLRNRSDVSTRVVADVSERLATLSVLDYVEEDAAAEGPWRDSQLIARGSYTLVPAWEAFAVGRSVEHFAAELARFDNFEQLLDARLASEDTRAAERRRIAERVAELFESRECVALFRDFSILSGLTDTLASPATASLDARGLTPAFWRRVHAAAAGLEEQAEGAEQGAQGTQEADDVLRSALVSNGFFSNNAQWLGAFAAAFDRHGAAQDPGTAARCFEAATLTHAVKTVCGTRLGSLLAYGSGAPPRQGLTAVGGGNPSSGTRADIMRRALDACPLVLAAAHRHYRVFLAATAVYSASVASGQAEDKDKDGGLSFDEAEQRRRRRRHEHAATCYFFKNPTLMRKLHYLASVPALAGLLFPDDPATSCVFQNVSTIAKHLASGQSTQPDAEPQGLFSAGRAFSNFRGIPLVDELCLKVPRLILRLEDVQPSTYALLVQSIGAYGCYLPLSDVSIGDAPPGKTKHSAAPKSHLPGTVHRRPGSALSVKKRIMIDMLSLGRLINSDRAAQPRKASHHAGEQTDSAAERDLVALLRLTVDEHSQNAEVPRDFIIAYMLLRVAVALAVGVRPAAVLGKPMPHLYANQFPLFADAIRATDIMKTPAILPVASAFTTGLPYRLMPGGRPVVSRLPFSMGVPQDFNRHLVAHYGKDLPDYESVMQKFRVFLSKHEGSLECAQRETMAGFVGPMHDVALVLPKSMLSSCHLSTRSAVGIPDGVSIFNLLANATEPGSIVEGFFQPEEQACLSALASFSLGLGTTLGTRSLASLLAANMVIYVVDDECQTVRKDLLVYKEFNFFYGGTLRSAVFEQYKDLGAVHTNALTMGTAKAAEVTADDVLTGSYGGAGGTEGAAYFKAQRNVANLTELSSAIILHEDTNINLLRPRLNDFLGVYVISGCSLPREIALPSRISMSWSHFKTSFAVSVLTVFKLCSEKASLPPISLQAFSEIAANICNLVLFKAFSFMTCLNGIFTLYRFFDTVSAATKTASMIVAPSDLSYSLIADACKRASSTGSGSGAGLDTGMRVHPQARTAVGAAEAAAVRDVLFTLIDAFKFDFKQTSANIRTAPFDSVIAAAFIAFSLNGSVRDATMSSCINAGELGSIGELSSYTGHYASFTVATVGCLRGSGLGVTLSIPPGVLDGAGAGAGAGAAPAAEKAGGCGEMLVLLPSTEPLRYDSRDLPLQNICNHLGYDFAVDYVIAMFDVPWAPQDDPRSILYAASLYELMGSSVYCVDEDMARPLALLIHALRRRSPVAAACAAATATAPSAQRPLRFYEHSAETRGSAGLRPELLRSSAHPGNKLAYEAFRKTFVLPLTDAPKAFLGAVALALMDADAILVFEGLGSPRVHARNYRFLHRLLGLALDRATAAKQSLQLESASIFLAKPLHEFKVVLALAPGRDCLTTLKLAALTTQRFVDTCRVLCTRRDLDAERRTSNFTYLQYTQHLIQAVVGRAYSCRELYKRDIALKARSHDSLLRAMALLRAYVRQHSGVLRLDAPAGGPAGPGAGARGDDPAAAFSDAPGTSGVSGASSAPRTGAGNLCARISAEEVAAILDAPFDRAVAEFLAAAKDDGGSGVADRACVRLASYGADDPARRESMAEVVALCKGVVVDEFLRFPEVAKTIPLRDPECLDDAEYVTLAKTGAREVCRTYAFALAAVMLFLRRLALVHMPLVVCTNPHFVHRIFAGVAAQVAAYTAGEARAVLRGHRRALGLSDERVDGLGRPLLYLFKADPQLVKSLVKAFMLPTLTAALPDALPHEVAKQVQFFVGILFLAGANEISMDSPPDAVVQAAQAGRLHALLVPGTDNAAYHGRVAAALALDLPAALKTMRAFLMSLRADVADGVKLSMAQLLSDHLLGKFPVRTIELKSEMRATPIADINNGLVLRSVDQMLPGIFQLSPGFRRLWLGATLVSRFSAIFAGTLDWFLRNYSALARLAQSGSPLAALLSACFARASAGTPAEQARLSGAIVTLLAKQDIDGMVAFLAAETASTPLVGMPEPLVDLALSPVFTEFLFASTILPRKLETNVDTLARLFARTLGPRTDSRARAPATCVRECGILVSAAGSTAAAAAVGGRTPSLVDSETSLRHLQVTAATGLCLLLEEFGGAYNPNVPLPAELIAEPLFRVFDVGRFVYAALDDYLFRRQNGLADAPRRAPAREAAAPTPVVVLMYDRALSADLLCLFAHRSNYGDAGLRLPERCDFRLMRPTDEDVLSFNVVVTADPACDGAEDLARVHQLLRRRLVHRRNATAVMFPLWILVPTFSDARNLLTPPSAGYVSTPAEARRRFAACLEDIVALASPLVVHLRAPPHNDTHGAFLHSLSVLIATAYTMRLKDATEMRRAALRGMHAAPAGALPSAPSLHGLVLAALASSVRMATGRFNFGDAALALGLQSVILDNARMRLAMTTLAAARAGAAQPGGAQDGGAPPQTGRLTSPHACGRSSVALGSAADADAAGSPSRDVSRIVEATQEESSDEGVEAEAEGDTGAEALAAPEEEPSAADDSDGRRGPLSDSSTSSILYQMDCAAGGDAVTAAAAMTAAEPLLPVDVSAAGDQQIHLNTTIQARYSSLAFVHSSTACSDLSLLACAQGPAGDLVESVYASSVQRVFEPLVKRLQHGFSLLTERRLSASVTVDEVLSMAKLLEAEKAKEDEAETAGPVEAAAAEAAEAPDGAEGAGGEDNAPGGADSDGSAGSEFSDASSSRSSSVYGDDSQSESMSASDVLSQSARSSVSARSGRSARTEMSLTAQAVATGGKVSSDKANMFVALVAGIGIYKQETINTLSIDFAAIETQISKLLSPRARKLKERDASMGGIVLDALGSPTAGVLGQLVGSLYLHSKAAMAQESAFSRQLRSLACSQFAVRSYHEMRQITVDSSLMHDAAERYHMATVGAGAAARQRVSTEPRRKVAEHLETSHMPPGFRVYLRSLKSYRNVLYGAVNRAISAEDVLTSILPESVSVHGMVQEIGLEQRTLDDRGFLAKPSHWVFSGATYASVLGDVFTFLKVMNGSRLSIPLHQQRVVVTMNKPLKAPKILADGSIDLGYGDKKLLKVHMPFYVELCNFELVGAAYDPIIQSIVDQTPESQTGYSSLFSLYASVAVLDNDVSPDYYRERVKPLIDCRALDSSYLGMRVTGATLRVPTNFVPVPVRVGGYTRAICLVPNRTSTPVSEWLRASPYFSVKTV